LLAFDRHFDFPAQTPRPDEHKETPRSGALQQIS
jgi:hypothetical protein